MEEFTFYLLKSSIWLTGFALVYFLFLRNERFFKLNRIFLLSGILLSIAFPLITLHYTVVIPVTPTLPEIEVSESQFQRASIVEESHSTPNLLLVMYLVGITFISIRMFSQIFSIFRTIQKSETHQSESFKLIRTEKYPSSFSFISFVFVNPSINETEMREIVNHEEEHIRQKHWVDLLLFEIIRAIQWFNPIAWLYGHLIRQNHEYLADEYAVMRSANPAIYRAALLNQMFGGPVISLTNSFNYSLNKKRFSMMKNTIKSPIRKLKLLIVLPLIATVFYAFATPNYQYSVEETSEISQDHNYSLASDTITKNTFEIVEQTDTLPTIIEKTEKSILFIIDGKEATNDEFKKMDQDEIESIEIIKKAYLQEKYGAKGKDGVIIIKTKKGNSIVMDNSAKSYAIGYNNPKNDFSLTQNPRAKLKIRNSSSSMLKPLIIVGGDASVTQDINSIDPETIRSVSITKGEYGIRKYGEIAKDGVIEITLKPTVDVQPDFPGGRMAMLSFIKEKMVYPAEAIEKGITGQVIVKFVIEKDGSLSNLKVLRGVDPSLDKEALRIVQSMPNWIPASRNGENVSVEYDTNINFILPPAKISSEKLQEFKPSKFGKIEWQNNTVYTSGALDNALEIKEGDEYSKEKLENNINEQVSGLYLDNGYLFFDIKKIEIPQKDGSVDLKFIISEGKQYKIGKIEINGNKEVPLDEIKKKIGLKSGDLYSKTKLTGSINAIKMLDKFVPDKIYPEVIPEQRNGKYGKVNFRFNLTEQ